MTDDALAKARADIAALRARVAEIEDGISRGGAMSEPNETMNSLIRGMEGRPAEAYGAARPDPRGPGAAAGASPAPAGPPGGSRAQGDGGAGMNDLIRRRGGPAPDPSEHVSPEMRAYLEERGIDVDLLNKTVIEANRPDRPTTGGDSTQEDN